LPQFPLPEVPVPEVPLPRAHWPAGPSVPVRETTIGSVLRAAAGRAPDATALIDGDLDRPGRRQWTFAELLADAERAARALLTRFSPGERVALWAPNCPEWIIAEFGAALAGLVVVTVNPAYRGDELAHVLGDSAADGLFLADRFRQQDMAAVLAEVRGRLPRLREVLSFGEWDAFTAAGGREARPLPEVAPSSPAQVIYTSGTTGRPKGAVLTLGPVQAGAAQVLMPRFSPALELELIETHRVTLLCRVPTMFLSCSVTPTWPSGTSRRCAG
jgi:acyl-CoA synthetase (AMP-forming)/AMP-acid ligase II